MISILCPPLFTTNVFYTNIRSFNFKRNEVSSLLKLHNIDILVLTETWLTSAYSDSMLDLDSYVLYRKDRINRGGGLLIGVKNFFPTQSFSYNFESEIIGIDLFINSDKAYCSLSPSWSR